MKYRSTPVILIGLALATACHTNTPTLNQCIAETEGLEGRQQYLNSPYMTAGNRLYSVGHQNGSFPELGWHIKDEMGGIWNHPIKLMDGFDASITVNAATQALNKASRFINHPYGNRHFFAIETAELDIVRTQFVPDDLEGMMVSFDLIYTGAEPLTCTFQFDGHVDLRPTWLAERAQMTDAQDVLTYDNTNLLWSAKDQQNPWYCLFGSDSKPDAQTTSTSPYQGLGKTGTLVYTLNLKPGTTQTLSFFIAGAYQSVRDAYTTFETLKKSWHTLVADKGQRYEAIERQSKLTTPDEQFNTVYRWIKYNADWFVREVPEHGKGIAAGYPDYPWWFGCDSEFALQGYLSTGQFDITTHTIQLLHSLSTRTNDNGRIVHEVSTNGVVFNKGNTNETPQFASLVWHAYLWTGDQALLDDHFETIVKGIDWLFDEKDENRNLFPEGAGMMEIHGLESEMIDVASYTQRALEDAEKMARVLKRDSLANRYGQMARTLKEKINQRFWAEDFASYADFIGHDHEALQLIEDALVRADTLNKPWAVEELKATRNYIRKNPNSETRPFVLHHNWVVNTPMEMKIADPEKAEKALQTARRFVNPFGVFVTGIDRDEASMTDDKSFQGSKQFSYTGAVMTLPTGVSAIAENNYGHPDQALDYLKKMGKSFGFALPGSLYEVSPDYGMFAQAWNIYSYAYPVVQQFFGLQPQAAKKKVVIQPQRPAEWETASLKNVRMGTNAVSITYARSDETLTIVVTSIESGWDINVVPPAGYTLQEEKKAPSNRTSYLYRYSGSTSN